MKNAMKEQFALTKSTVLTESLVVSNKFDYPEEKSVTKRLLWDIFGE